MENRKRSIQVKVRLNDEEYKLLESKIKKSGLNTSTFLRVLITGAEVKEHDPERAKEMLRYLSSISNNMNQLAAKANSLGYIDRKQFYEEKEKWKEFHRQYMKEEYGDGS